MSRSSSAVARTTSALPIKTLETFTAFRGNSLHAVEALVEPGMIVASLIAVALHIDRALNSSYLLLAGIAFVLCYPGRPRLSKAPYKAALKILAGWAVMSIPLLIFVWATDHYPKHYNHTVLVWWWVIAPIAAFAGHMIFRGAVPLVRALLGSNRAVIVGMNVQGIELARQVLGDPYTNAELLGFFDDRAEPRHQVPTGPFRLLGSMEQMTAFIKRERVSTIYLSLPMASQPRIQRLLEELRDTTASIYFVPDMFVTDLIQGGISTIGNMPVVAVCESPFNGWNAFVKRVSDIIIASIILIAALPLMLVIAAGIKLTSPGPVLYKQRRYGLDGREIVVYKFRSMKVCDDDSSEIRQASEGDPRITPFGALLRKTSMDELPQFVNVLQGRMSIVGPRPHALAHNEMYRKIISGYMVRHKVRPGITGWAQVNTFRGETKNLEQMENRVRYDLEYLRKWSLRFDIYIMFKTVWVILGRKNAY